MSIRKLATEVGISHNTLAGYERTTIMPSLENGAILAEFFDVPIEYLVKGKTVIADFHDSNLLSLFREIDEMERRDRAVVKKYLSRFIQNRREREELEEESDQAEMR